MVMVTALVLAPQLCAEVFTTQIALGCLHMIHLLQRVQWLHGSMCCCVKVIDSFGDLKNQVAELLHGVLLVLSCVHCEILKLWIV